MLGRSHCSDFDPKVPPGIMGNGVRPVVARDDNVQAHRPRESMDLTFYRGHIDTGPYNAADLLSKSITCRFN